MTRMDSNALTAPLLSTSSGKAVPAGEVTLSAEFRARFQLERLLGSGAMGTVYLARDLRMDRPVAAKFLRAVSDDLLERFVREGKLQARISHPNVVHVLDAGGLDGHPYLITEYLSGGSLRERANRLRVTDAVAVVRRCLAGLAACHAAGIVHRDLKPENILFDDAGEPKIADLGIARSTGDIQPLTQTGALIGTPLYMSPEQMRGESAGPGADVYSMGMVLYELIAGKHPLAGLSLVDIFTRQSALPPLTGVEPGLVAAVAAAMASDPAARPGALAFAETLAGFEVRRASRPVRVREAPVSAPPRTPRRVWPVALAALVLAIAGGRGFRSPPSSAPSAASSATPMAAWSATPGVDVQLAIPLPPRAAARIGDSWLRQGSLELVEMSPDGRWILTTDYRSGDVRIWNVPARRLARTIRMSWRVSQARFLDANRFVTVFNGSAAQDARRDIALDRGRIPIMCLWDASTGAQLERQDTSQRGTTVPCISADGGVAAWCDGKRAPSRISVRRFRHDSSIIELNVDVKPKRLELSPDGSVLVAQFDRVLRRCHLSTRAWNTGTPVDAEQPALERGLAVTGPRTAVVGSADAVYLVDLDGKQPTRKISDLRQSQLRTTADGSELTCSGVFPGGQPAFELIDLRTLRARPLPFSACIPAMDGKHLLELRSPVRILDRTTLLEAPALRRQGRDLLIAKVAPTGDRVLARTGRDTGLLELADQKLRLVADPPAGEPYHRSFSPDGRLLLETFHTPEFASFETRAVDAIGARILGAWTPERFTTASFAGNDRVIELGPEGLSLRDAVTGKVQRAVSLDWRPGFNAEPITFLVNAPGTHLAWSAQRRSVPVEPAAPLTRPPHILDIRRPVPASAMPDVYVGSLTVTDEMLPLAFSPDGSVLAASDSWDRVCLVDAASGQITRRFKVDRVAQVVWSPRGTQLACLSPRGVSVIDTRTSARLFEAESDVEALIELGFDAARGRLLALTGELSALIWETGTTE